MNDGADADGSEDRGSRVVALFEDCVREELRITNQARGLGLSDDHVEDLVHGVTSGVLYAFSLDWDPDWVKAGEFHSWKEADEHLARCPHCLVDSPAASTAEEAIAWVRQHLRSNHS